MPRLNGTGPMGQGPLTGRGLGPCGGGRAYGFSGRRGGGMGFGWRKSTGYYPTLTEKEEKEALLEESNILEKELKTIKSRLNQLKNK